MNPRGRLLVGTVWILVAGLMAISLDPANLSSVNSIARLIVVLTALFLAVVYLFDPWDVLSRQPFH